MGKLKRHIQPSDITINIRKGAPVPEFLIHEERYHFRGSFIHKLCMQIGSLHVSSVSLCRWVEAGRRWNKIILLHAWPFGMIQLAKRISSMFSWQQAAHWRGKVIKRNMRSQENWRWKSSVSMGIFKSPRTYLIDKLALQACNEKVHPIGTCVQ